MRISLSLLLQTVVFIYSALQLQVCLIKSVQFSSLKVTNLRLWSAVAGGTT